MWIPISVLSVVYIVSCYGTYKAIQTNYSVGGKYERLEPCSIDVAAMFLPLINTVISLNYLIGVLVLARHKTISKFFKVTKQ